MNNEKEHLENLLTAISQVDDCLYQIYANETDSVINDRLQHVLGENDNLFEWFDSKLCHIVYEAKNRLKELKWPR